MSDDQAELFHLFAEDATAEEIVAALLAEATELEPLEAPRHGAHASST